MWENHPRKIKKKNLITRKEGGRSPKIFIKSKKSIFNMNMRGKDVTKVVSERLDFNMNMLGLCCLLKKVVFESPWSSHCILARWAQKNGDLTQEGSMSVVEGSKPNWWPRIRERRPLCFHIADLQLKVFQFHINRSQTWNSPLDEAILTREIAWEKACIREAEVERFQAFKILVWQPSYSNQVLSKWKVLFLG